MSSPEAAALSTAAATWFEGNNDVYGHRLALVLLGMAALSRGAVDEADRLHARAVTLARAFRQPRDLAIALHMHAAVHVARGDFPSAEPLLLEALAEARKDPAYFAISYTLDLLAEGIGLNRDPLRAAPPVRLGAEMLRGCVSIGIVGWACRASSVALLPT